jgi:cytochrome c oxidase subunit 1
MTGRMYDQRAATVAWLVLFIGFNILYFPMFILGWQGMPRRYFDYLPQFTSLQVLSTVGGWILAVGLILMVVTLVRGMRRGPVADPNPWGGATLEWQIPHPVPPHEDFEEIPNVTHGPYHYTEKGEPSSGARS